MFRSLKNSVNAQAPSHPSKEVVAHQSGGISEQEHLVKHPSPMSERISLRIKIGYGAGGICDFLFLTVPNNMALPIYSKHFGMDTRVLGLATALPRLVAAGADSLIGNISDNTRSRWGRRRPFVLLGAAAGAVMLPFMWNPPTIYGNAGLFMYITLLMCIYSIFYSIFFVPYQALGYELSSNYDERTRVQAWKGCMSGIGFFMAPWFFWFCSLSLFPNLVVGVRWLSGIAGAIMLLGAVLAVIFSPEKVVAQKQAQIPLGQALKFTFQNQAFLLLQGGYLFMQVGVCCGGTVGFYLLLDYVCGGDEKFFGLLLGISGTVSNLATYAGMVLGVWLSTHLDKRRTALLGLSGILLGVTMLIVFLAPSYGWLPLLPKKYHPWLTMLPGILMNLGLQSCNLMFGSMTADICDEDELATGMRREGAYASVSGVLNQAVMILLLGFAGFMPFLAGYTNMTVKPSLEQLLGMKWILIATQFLFILGSMGFMAFYPITRSQSERTQYVLQQRKRQSAEIDRTT